MAKKSFLDRYALSTNSSNIVHAHSIPQSFRPHLHTPEHASTNFANYNEHILSLYEASDYSHNPTKTKLFYCTAPNHINRNVHNVWI